MLLNELVFKCWNTDTHGSRYVFVWGKPSSWALGFDFYPPHDAGGCYEHRRGPAGESVRVDYTKRAWSLEVTFLWRGFRITRVKQRPR